MKKIFVCIMVLAFVICSWTALAQQTEKEMTTTKKSATGEPQVVRGRMMTETATVEAIDPANRMVTLKGPKGNLYDVKAGDEVKNFSQIEVGDKVTARYYQAVAVEVRKPGEAPGPAATQKETMGRAKPGEKPAGFAAEQTTITTTVTAIAPDKSSVTLKGPEGKTTQVSVRDPRNLEKVKVGDQVMITYTEAMAVSVEKAHA